MEMSFVNARARKGQQCVRFKKCLLRNSIVCGSRTVDLRAVHHAAKIELGQCSYVSNARKVADFFFKSDEIRSELIRSSVTPPSWQ